VRLRDWFIAPAPPPDAGDEGAPPPIRTSGRQPPRDSATAWAPPVDALPLRSAPAGISSDHAAARSVASAAVIGRPGEAEPVAASVALALRGGAPAAAVIVVGKPYVPNADGGTRAARRLASRFGAHGFDVAARGRLAWIYAEPDAARRAARVAVEPVVLAVTVPLDSALEVAIEETDVAIVVARDGHGPLAQIAIASLTCSRLTTTSPLPRGIARLLARHGVRAPASVRAALD
jgi:hypothetical protein